MLFYIFKLIKLLNLSNTLISLLIINYQLLFLSQDIKKKLIKNNWWRISKVLNLS